MREDDAWVERIRQKQHMEQKATEDRASVLDSKRTEDAADILKNTQADTAVDFKNVQGQTDTLEQILDQNGLDHLKRLLQNIPTLTGNTDLFEVQEEEEARAEAGEGLESPEIKPDLE